MLKSLYERPSVERFRQFQGADGASSVLLGPRFPNNRGGRVASVVVRESVDCETRDFR